MKTWRDYHNYRRLRNGDGSHTYIITVDGADVEVSEAVYKAYAAGARKMKYMELDLKRNRILQDADGNPVLDGNGLSVMLSERETSLDKLTDEDWEFPSSSPSAEDAALGSDNAETEALHRCIALLEDEEQDLMQAVFFDGVSEQEYADTLGVTRQAINKQKLKILKKLRELMEEGF